MGLEGSTCTHYYSTRIRATCPVQFLDLLNPNKTSISRNKNYENNYYAISSSLPVSTPHPN
jgi:hypothetical protein